MNEDRDEAKAYFDKLAPEYDRAFRLEGQGPLAAAVNRLFRGRTFRRRMRRLEGLFHEIGLDGRTVLDLGCGSGQVSLLAASMGARVLGIDIAPGMLAIAAEAAAHAGLAERLRFEEGDIASSPLPESDVTLLVGVIEYYRDFGTIVRRAAEATRRTLVIAHTTRVLYRMLLRRTLLAFRGAHLYFHPMSEVIAAVEALGFRLVRRIDEHAFATLVFERRG